MYRVRETAFQDASVNKHTQQDQWVDYNGEVFCVSVPNRVLVIRRDDKVALCGNCYDSLGAGRSSPEYHKHIIEVGHLSTIEHAHFTVVINWPDSKLLYQATSVLLNRPGIFVDLSEQDRQCMRVTANLRAVLDFDKWSAILPCCFPIAQATIGSILHSAAVELAPMVISQAITDHIDVEWQIVEPENPMEQHITLFMAGSRGFTHELVRHRFNISQRSTRYCNESESPWVEHPLISRYLRDNENEINVEVLSSAQECIGAARSAYSKSVLHLESYLIGRGIDKFTARKQARGAARGYLGNALYTELFFTAPVTMWRWMLDLRATVFADAEIRAVFCEALPALKASRYGKSFSDYSLEPSPDGIGQVAVKRDVKAS
jgi:thymidylate synthase ThyX